MPRVFRNWCQSLSKAWVVKTFWGSMTPHRFRFGKMRPLAFGATLRHSESASAMSFGRWAQIGDSVLRSPLNLMAVAVPDTSHCTEFHGALLMSLGLHPIWQTINARTFVYGSVSFVAAR